MPMLDQEVGGKRILLCGGDMSGCWSGGNWGASLWCQHVPVPCQASFDSGDLPGT